MGGTISGIGMAPALPATVVGASTVGGETSSLSSMNGAALPSTGAAPAAGSSPVLGGGPIAPPPGAPAGDIATAIAQLQGALSQLAAVLSAMGGAGQLGTPPGPVSGGGAPGAGATGCGCGGQSPTQSPTQSPVQRPTSPGDDVSQHKDGKLPEAPPLGADGGVRDKIVAAAKAELAKGVKEDAGADNDKAGNIKRYRGAVTGPGEDPNAAEPWCADFASYVWKQAGVPFGKGGKGEDYTVAMIAHAKANGTWTDRAKATPKPGDLVLIDWERGSSVDHVAVVTKVDPDGTVHTIGGNESDAVKESSYKQGDTRMMGFITPQGG
ncbi:MAG: hypothetical protein JWM86_1915 [Thermoleophilia bacterium]|nr:hypothetical protein [Thermoleophilia bacterium]